MTGLVDFIRQQAQSQFVGGGLVLMFTGSIVALCRSLPGRAYGAVKGRLVRSIAIDNSDPLFDFVTYWLNSQERFNRSRFLKATTQMRLSSGNMGAGDAATPCSVGSGSTRKKEQMRVFFSPAHGRHFFRYKGIWVSIGRDSGAPNANGRGGSTAEQSGGFTPQKESYAVEGYGKATSSLLRELVLEIVAFGTEETEGVRLYYTTWGHWQSNGYQRMRPLSTVVLPAGVGEGVLSDMSEFRGEQNWYRDLGIPWHRGYLFYGLPGTGKSSLAAALAGELGMDIYLLSLSGTGMNDETLQRLMADVRPGCMVIMEDVDCTVPDRDAAVSSNRISLSGLLNCLDGIMSREGCLIVMTTNRREALDTALIRPGRIDMEIEFGHADLSQIERLAARLGVDCDGLRGGAFTMAEVQKELVGRYRAQLPAVAA